MVLPTGRKLPSNGGKFQRGLGPFWYARADKGSISARRGHDFIALIANHDAAQRSSQLDMKAFRQRGLNVSVIAFDPGQDAMRPQKPQRNSPVVMDGFVMAHPFFGAIGAAAAGAKNGGSAKRPSQADNLAIAPGLLYLSE
jgi:hypothetical protein